MSQQETFDPQSLTGNRLGPYCSYNPVSRVQIWQWCSAMGDHSPLYLDAAYQRQAGISGVTAPPAMMQMWTMRDVNMAYAPGSTDAPPYQVFDTLSEHGFDSNVAVSYDIQIHRYLIEGDRASHYTTIINISDLKQTAIGTGYFVTERVEYLDQHEQLFAEALITYFQYRSAQTPPTGNAQVAGDSTELSAANILTNTDTWRSRHEDVHWSTLSEGQALPTLVIPINHKLIVAGAIATQDYIGVHHNAPAARSAAMPDIFMNILTTCGLCARYLSDWAGPASRLHRLQFKLMTPNVPGEVMRMDGKVAALETTSEEGMATVTFAGTNNTGMHVAGSAELTLSN